MPELPLPDARQQSLRLKRFLIASTTYALGFVILALCSAMGLFSTGNLWAVGFVFLAVNLGFFSAIRSGWNQRFEDPALTQAQVCVGVALVALILMLGEQVHFLAVPFYSSLFVFAMLKLNPRELFDVEVFVLVSYFAAMAVRVHLFAGTLDLRVEAINAALVVLSSIWYALAASYISKLRARLRTSFETIEQFANRDALTDTWNRRHLDTLLGVELQRKARIGGRLCVCLVDVDHFKRVNDSFGHLVGDAVLKGVARSMEA
jgi:diguanylate cyclase